MNYRTILSIFTVVLTGCLAAQAEVKITIGHNIGDDATPKFKFKNVPLPSSSNAAMTAKFTIVDGESDPASGGLSKLNDGRLPDEEDQPENNFFFNAGSAGGRLEADLGKVISIRQINTYSWHPGARGPQVYKLYAGDGASENFNVALTNGINPESCGWKRIAAVNTKTTNDTDNGGQYGASISDTDGIVGKYRYLLFDVASTEGDDAFGNTFYSEISVVDADAAIEKAVVETTAAESFAIKTADGKCEISISASAAPELNDWAENKLMPVLAEWYPKIVALLPSEGFTAPAHFSLTLKPMKGVAYTSGTKVVANSTWLETELKGEAIGSLVHEMVHVVQQYHGDNPGWLVEGTADYIRWFKYEPESRGADIIWLRKHGKTFSPHYNDGYRITANFLNWVSEKYDQNIVSQMNTAMRENKYDEGLWKKYTGKTVQELGAKWEKEIEA